MDAPGTTLFELTVTAKFAELLELIEAMTPVPGVSYAGICCGETLLVL